MMEWEFKARRRKKGGDAQGPRQQPACQIGCCDATVPAQAVSRDGATVDPQDVLRVKARVLEHVATMRGGAFLKGTTASVRADWADVAKRCRSRAGKKTEDTAGAARSVGRLLCLGIGSPASSISSAYQMALAVLLAEALGIEERAWADPQMSALDVAVGDALGFKSLDSSKSAAASRPGQRPLLLYMPHCDRSLYEAVLAANVQQQPDGTASAPELARCLLVANSFGIYFNRDDVGVKTPGMSGVKADSLLQRFSTCVAEHRMRDFEPCVEAFNDMAVISFPRELDMSGLISGDAGQHSAGVEASADEADSDDADDCLLWHSRCRGS